MKNLLSTPPPPSGLFIQSDISDRLSPDVVNRHRFRQVVLNIAIFCVVSILRQQIPQFSAHLSFIICIHFGVHVPEYALTTAFGFPVSLKPTIFPFFPLSFGSSMPKLHRQFTCSAKKNTDTINR